MIYITHKDNSLEVTGHSYFADLGSDIVCAAVSALICGACEIWKNNSDFVIEQNSKIPKIKITLKKIQNKNEIEFLFLIEQLKLVKKHHPNQILWQ